MNPEQELETVARHFRAQGCRWTAQREGIVRAAFATHDHFTAEELLAHSREVDPRVSRATVYRTLLVLEQAGFVEGLDAGDGGRRFELAGDTNRDHHHLVCVRCGQTEEFESHDVLQAGELLVVLAAAKLGATRLIDNMEI